MAIKEVISCVFIGIGVLIFVLSTMGIFRYKYVLNRMHIAAQSDTLGLFSIFIGVGILTGFSFSTLKLIAILMFYWITGPVSSHIIANMELGSIEAEDQDQFRIKDMEKN